MMYRTNLVLMEIDDVPTLSRKKESSSEESSSEESLSEGSSSEDILSVRGAYSFESNDMQIEIKDLPLKIYLMKFLV